MKDVYDEEFDRMLLNWSDKIKSSREFQNCNIIVDFEEDGTIGGIEIEDFKKKFDESQKEVERILKGASKK